MPGNPMTKEAASRIQSSQDKNGKDTGKNSFASRAQSAGDKRDAAFSGGQSQQGQGQQGQGQQGQGQHGQGNH